MKENPGEITYQRGSGEEKWERLETTRKGV